MRRWRAMLVVFLGLLVAAVLWVVFWMPLPEVFFDDRYQEPTRIYDAQGQLLYEVSPPAKGRKYYVPLSAIPEMTREATVLLEDKEFYHHHGVDIGAVLRAIWSNVRYGRVFSGASTIPQQLVRNMLGTERERNWQAKVYESLLALRISHLYSKSQVLELYLNTVFYGNNAYGLEAAAQEYFGKHIGDLDLAEMTMIVGIPKAPSRYNPLLYPDASKERQKEVLGLLEEHGYITAEESERALAEEVQFQRDVVTIRAPHFVQYVIDQLIDRYGEDAVYFDGLDVQTTLDLGVYNDIQEILRKRVATLAPYHVTNASVVVLDNKTGGIVSFNGSLDYFNERIDGSVSMPFAYRQPGSTLKPFVYLMAFEQGRVPATPIADVEKRFFTEEGNPYLPKNYDGTYHGLVSIREALANSYNIPAVSMVQELGVMPVVHMLERIDLHMLGANNPQSLGLAVALGDGEVTLFGLANAYRMLANYGIFTDVHGVEQVNEEAYEQVSRQEKLFSPEDVYLITNILSDNNARLAEFGEENFLHLPFPVAAKTGTTRNFRDNWVFGYSPRYTVGVWVGNADGSPMQDVSGVTGAGPIFYDVMLRLHRNELPQPFYVPPRIVSQEVCSVSGLLPSDACQERRLEVFPDDRVPKTTDVFWQKTSQGYEIVYPESVASWALAHGYKVSTESTSEGCIMSPHHFDTFQIAPDRPMDQQMVNFKSCRDDTEWFLNGRSLGHGRNLSWQLGEGTYTLRAVFSTGEEQVDFTVL